MTEKNSILWKLAIVLKKNIAVYFQTTTGQSTTSIPTICGLNTGQHSKMTNHFTAKELLFQAFFNCWSILTSP